MFIDDDSINLISLVNLKPDELIDWINTRKKKLSLSNAKLSMLTNVPEGTLDRILTGKNPEFRYSTIQPVVALLIDEADLNSNTIKIPNERLLEEIDFLKTSNETKDEIIKELQKQNAFLQKLIDKGEE